MSTALLAFVSISINWKLCSWSHVFQCVRASECVCVQSTQTQTQNQSNVYFNQHTCKPICFQFECLCAFLRVCVAACVRVYACPRGSHTSTAQTQRVQTRRDYWRPSTLHPRHHRHHQRHHHHSQNHHHHHPNKTGLLPATPLQTLRHELSSKDLLEICMIKIHIQGVPKKWLIVCYWNHHAHAKSPVAGTPCV